MKTSSKTLVSSALWFIGLGAMASTFAAPAFACDPASADPACPLSLSNPANPLSQYNISNPANAASPQNPSNLGNPSNLYNPSNPLDPTNQANPSNPLSPLNPNNPASPYYRGARVRQPDLGELLFGTGHSASESAPAGYETEAGPAEPDAPAPRRHHRHRRHDGHLRG